MTSELRDVLTEAQQSVIRERVSMALHAAESNCLEQGQVPGYSVMAEAAVTATCEALASLPGVAVIQLPEPEVWDGPGKERYWRIGDTTVTVDKWNMLSVTLNDDWSDDETPPSAADFRDLAAALLAAAVV
ncbi:hypothetical protein OLP41_gp007 [Mycobacterium phage I3]|uniref:Uncharacterized protein n=1 Tax=Mycobacterium phage I3 TaxID=2994057 RepID=A0A8F2E779_9CAUD|nr:hypothetical protein OLP41_gp007 [Mycobacterium phage I3]QWT30293.1 hypothetical protein PBI_I3_7 [Mycobacterium phage I3]